MEHISLTSDAPDRPLVSIALPAFNAAQTIGLAIASIRAQTYEHWELLVLDDGSTDATAQIVRSVNDRRIRLLSDAENRGLSMRLNQAIDVAGGSLLARMDADDIAYPERLERQVRFLLARPEIDLVATRAIVFQGDGEIRGLLPFCERHEDICRHPWATFPMPHPTWMGRIGWFRANRYRIPEVRRAEDQDILIRSFKRSRFECLPEVLLGYRQGKYSLSRQLIARWNLAGAHIRGHLGGGHPAYALMGGAYQLIKSVFDLLAAIPGLNVLYVYRFMGKVPDAEELNWKNLWRKAKGWEDRLEHAKLSPGSS